MGDDLLRGEKVYLARPQMDDAPVISTWDKNLGYLRDMMMAVAYPFTLDDIQGWIQSRSANEPGFCVRLLDTDQLIGYCTYKDVRWASRHAKFAVGIGEPGMRGHGYGTDATRVLLRYGFMEMGLNCIALEVFSFNAAGVRAYEKVGFKLDGTMRDFLFRDGKFHDMHLMSMTRAEWDERYGGKSN
jgi:RimJ/RimL family protein N-acetyltransferase